MRAVLRRDGALTTRLSDPRAPAVAQAWRRLQADGAVTTPFLSWQWFGALVADPETAGGIRTIVVSDATGTIGLVPFQQTTDHRRLRVAHTPGGRWLAPDHIEVVALPRDRQRAADAAARHLRRLRSHDAIDFDGLRDGQLYRALDSHLVGPHHLRSQAPATVLPFVDLTAGPPARLHSRNTRKQMRRARRDAEAAGGGFTVHTDAAAVTAHLTQMMDLHDARFGERSEIYRGAARRRFHLRAAAALADDGLVRLYRLAEQDRDLALLYALVWGERLLAYGGGIRPAAGTPGHALTALAITSAAEEGFAVFDLLRGDSAWKRRFASGAVRNPRIRCLTLTPAALARSARWLALRTARRTRDAEAPT